MEGSNIQEAEIIPSVRPAGETSPEASDTKAKHAELNGMLAQARNVREMLTNFKAACEGATVSGHVVVRMAIGIQWLESMLAQNKRDIDELQNKLESK